MSIWSEANSDGMGACGKASWPRREWILGLAEFLLACVHTAMNACKLSCIIDKVLDFNFDTFQRNDEHAREFARIQALHRRSTGHVSMASVVPTLIQELCQVLLKKGCASPDQASTLSDYMFALFRHDSVFLNSRGLLIY